MAVHAHTTPARKPEPARGGPGRRSILSATMAGSMATLAAAVPVPVPVPDARLIGLAHAFAAGERLVMQHMIAGAELEPGTPEEVAHTAEMKRMDMTARSLLDAMLATPAVTLAGVQALAAAVVASDDELLDGGDGGWGGALLAHMLAGLLALPAGGSA